eukprot:5144434-Alexandrium_andersonii.AAC.1
MTEAERAFQTAPVADPAGLWKTPPKNLMQLPDSFVFDWLMGKSDLTLDHLLGIQKHDPKGAQKL